MVFLGILDGMYCEYLLMESKELRTLPEGAFITGSFFQHFRENSFWGKLLKSQNSAQFLAQTPKILFKTQFSGKNIEFLLHKKFENTTHTE